MKKDTYAMKNFGAVSIKGEKLLMFEWIKQKHIAIHFLITLQKSNFY